MAEIGVDYGDGRQVPEASVTEAEYKYLWGGKLLPLKSSFFVFY